MLSNFQRLRQRLKTTFVIDQAEEPIYPEIVQIKLQKIASRISLSDDETTKKQASLTPFLSVLSRSFDDEYILGELLGQGFHAIVKKCYHRTNLPKTTYAVKVLRTDDLEIMNIMKQTFLLASQLEHPNIIKHHKLFISSNRGVAYMIMEYSSYPSLQDLIQEKFKFTENLIKIVFQKIFQTLLYLHTKGICHRDIKPDNILMDPNTGDVKLIDFGVARRFIQSEPGTGKMKILTMMTQTGNFYYRAPEVYWHTGYKAGIDMWASGVTIYQLLCEELPFQQSNILNLIDVVKDESKHFYKNNPLFVQLSNPLKDLVKRLLQPNPVIRLQASSALRHPWLLSNNQTQANHSKDDLYLEKIKQLDQSDNYIKRTLTKSDQMGEQIPNKVSHKMTTIKELPNESRDSALEEDDEIVFEETTKVSFQEMLINFKQNTIIENIFVDKRVRNLQIKFIQTISNSISNSIGNSHLSLIKQIDTPLKIDLDQLFTGFTYCNSSKSLHNGDGDHFLFDEFTITQEKQIDAFEQI